MSGSEVITRNWHSIVGPNGMCECGIRADGTVVRCGDLLIQRAAVAEDALARLTPLMAKWRDEDARRYGFYFAAELERALMAPAPGRSLPDPQEPK